MLRFDPTVRIGFYRKKSTYLKGNGIDTEFEYIGALYCAWTNAHGDRAVQAQSLGVNQSATVRTFFHPEIYAALNDTQVLIVKNDISGVCPSDKSRIYELWGGVDNVLEENAFMEFKVRRYEAK